MKLTNKKILLFDWLNLGKRTCFAGHVQSGPGQIDYQIFNYSLWNSIFSACVKHKAESIILASDYDSWRKIIYKPYKQNRKLLAKKAIESGELQLDWNEFFANFNNFTQELIDNVPFIHLREKNCEADDIIGILCKHLSKDNKVTIISGDKDYQQCLKYKNVKLWNPGGYHVKPGFVVPEMDAEEWVNVQALMGQGKDNIYNVFTSVDFPIEYNIMRESTDTDPIRKPSLPEKKAKEIVFSGKLDEWLQKTGPEEAKKKNKLIEKENTKRLQEGKEPKVLHEEDVMSRFKTNKQLIDFDSIPKVLENRVLEQLENFEIIKTDNLFKFFKKMKWNEPIDNFSFVEQTIYNLY